ncbi:MAG: hypothetical protein R2794_13660 [Chitinophagales bacterium]
MAKGLYIVGQFNISLSAQQPGYWQQNVDYEINVTLDDVQHARWMALGHGFHQ